MAKRRLHAARRSAGWRGRNGWTHSARWMPSLPAEVDGKTCSRLLTSVSTRMPDAFSTYESRTYSRVPARVLPHRVAASCRVEALRRRRRARRLPAFVCSMCSSSADVDGRFTFQFSHFRSQVSAQMWASPGADVGQWAVPAPMWVGGQSRRRCGPAPALSWVSR